MGDASSSEIFATLLMQGFAGLSLFSVLLLMALGLAIIFGQMGVINMAHGEFMAIGAYTTYVMSQFAQEHELLDVYFPFALLAAFIIAGAAGYLMEILLIRHLYKRPLDTLLATWGASLILQQIFRSAFGAREVSPELPEWIMGSMQPAEGIDLPISGLFVLGLSAVVTAGVALMLFKSRWGLGVRAISQNRVIAGAVGIDTKRIDRLTFALGCGLAGVAGAAFTTIASTGPTSGSLYIVDTFLVVVFGGAASILGTIASAFAIGQAQSVLEFLMTGSTAKVLTLVSVVLILMMRPEGLFSAKVRR
ncbi:urea ABC transporter permease subunit UrtB [Methyloterricola oryzae]|uniref:urea ABC transporter permease subunit UrtB n=1 Tax=Methyloterricola oryzae TaxID=1495050 RepID=UPI0005EBED67|nr:urea ABC transporter permease subunit UrtB [Methyloterricola oryzae]